MTWTFVKGAQNVSSVSSPASVTLGAVVSGDVVCGEVFLNNVNSNTITSIVDDGTPVNTYIIINSATVTAAPYTTVSFWSGGPLTNGATKITVNATGALISLWITADEFTPPSGTPSLDGNNSGADNSGTSTPPVSGSFATTLNGDLIYAGAFANANNTVGAGFTVTEGSGTQFTSEFQVQSAFGSINPAFTNAATNQWTCNAFALKVVPIVLTPPVGIIGLNSCEW